MEKRGRQSFLTGILLLLIGTASFFYWGGKKEVWFCDEIYSYESANGFEQDWPAVRTGEWMSGEDVEAFFAADSQELSLGDITVRLYNDHVPLYFWLFRLVSFFLFKGSGSIWIGLVINLFFYLMFLWLVYRGFCRLTDSFLLSGAAVLLVCVFNRLMIQQATVLRMYMMLLWAELLLLLAGLRILQEAGRKKMSLWVYLFLFAASVAGFLTHYDYWIFYAAASGLFCGWLVLAALIKQKGRFWLASEFRYAAAWAGNFAVSLLTTILIFPYCRWNLNRGKGQTALKSLFVFSEEKGEQILWGYRHLSGALFGEALPAAVGLLIILGCIAGGLAVLYRRKEKGKAAGMLLVVLTAQLYQLAVCFTMPDVWEERYLWGAFTFMALCTAWGGILIFQAVCSAAEKKIPGGSRKKQWTVLRCTAAGMLFCAVLWGELLVIDGGSGVAYLFHPEKDVALLEENSGIPWVVYGPTVGVYSYYDWIMPEKICFLTGEDTLPDQEAVRDLEGDSFVLYIYEDYLPGAMDFFERELGRELESGYLTRSTNLSVYLVY